MIVTVNFDSVVFFFFFVAATAIAAPFVIAAFFHAPAQVLAENVQFTLNATRTGGTRAKESENGWSSKCCRCWGRRGCSTATLGLSSTIAACVRVVIPTPAANAVPIPVSFPRQ